MLSREIMNPMYCLFEYSGQGSYTLQINPGMLHDKLTIKTKRKLKQPSHDALVVANEFL